MDGSIQFNDESSDSTLLKKVFQEKDHHPIIVKMDGSIQFNDESSDSTLLKKVFQEKRSSSHHCQDGWVNPIQ
jgi:predicted secreted protein